MIQTPEDPRQLSTLTTDLPEPTYDPRAGCVIADPPWQFSNKASRAAAENHYNTMTLRKLRQLPVDDWARPDAHLYLWAVDALLEEAFTVMEEWGFTFKMTLVWVKTATAFFPDEGREIRPIPGAPLYYADNFGTIWSERKRGASQRDIATLGPEQSAMHALKPEVVQEGYHRVTLSLNDHKHRELVHRLIAYTFHGSPLTSGYQVAHLNGVRDDNRPENLAWKTQLENEADKIRHGTSFLGVFGANHPRHKDYNHKPIIGLGNYFRHSHELVLFGTRGKAPVLDHSIPSVFWAPRQEHSRKPDVLHTLAEKMSPGPYLEMFARRGRPGWSSWGAEAPVEEGE